MVLAIILAVLGSGAICLGSLVAIAAPGDGQTGMVCFPLWALGTALGIASIITAAATKAGRGAWIVIGILAVISVGSVVQSFVASIRYERRAPPEPAPSTSYDSGTSPRQPR